ncbi:hypothetical protein MKX68_03160 [Paenibacillus sp. FSL M8-0212]|uniref:hypothetical protein n=1 Tax=Paenibacillus sp. FSL M8-0212 TaxID=2921618 RepID=UPI0030F58B86
MRLKMSLLENAYDFLDSSLRYYSYAEDNFKTWKIAFINIVQSLELMTKEKLRRSNKFLIYENIDNPKNTISFSMALDRMINVLELPLDKKDIQKVKKAIALRNQMMHFEIDLPVQELKAKYSILFEFATSFHYRFLEGELHDFIDEDLWEIEAELMTYFKQKFLIYNSEEVHHLFPKDFIEAKYIKEYLIKGEAYPRVKYGEEKYKDGIRHTRESCAECMVKQGEFHVPGCDWEQCPRCFGQAIFCPCISEEQEIL